MMRLIFTSLILIIFAPNLVYAAEARLFLLSSGGVYQSNKEFVARLYVDSGGGKGVNAAESIIMYNPGQLKVNRVIKDKSIFDLWANGPKINSKTGSISFSGGTTKAYKGDAGLIMTVYFTPLKNASTSVVLTTATSKVLSADGVAPNILTSVGGGKYVFSNAEAVKMANAIRAKYSGSFLRDPADKNVFWYVNPLDKMRYKVDGKKSTDSYKRLLRLGARVKASVVKQYLNKAFPVAYAGKIIVNSTDNKAYYINSKNKKATLLKNAADTLKYITKNASTISIADFEIIPDATI